MMQILKARWKLITIIVVVLILGIGGYFGWQAYTAQQTAQAALLNVGEVMQITAVSTVDSSGTVTPIQSSNLIWKVTGTVELVNAKVGDKVKTGDVLMTLDPLTVPQTVITAQSDLIDAKKALDDLIKPPDLTVANARKAVADADVALKKAQDDLRSISGPVDQSYYDTIADAKTALDLAQGNVQLSADSSDVQAYNTQYNTTNRSYAAYLGAKERYENSNQNSGLYDAMKVADTNYQIELAKLRTLELKIQLDKTSKQDSVAKAQKKLNDAQTNLNYAISGPNSVDLAQAKAKVEVAQAQLADAKDKLTKLLSADPRDVASAMAKLQAAQAAADSLMIKAPFGGEILQVNYQKGDAVSTNATALVLANRTTIYLDVLVDETEVTRVKLGGRATITANPIPDVKMEGVVSRITTIGIKDQGLTKYSVRVDVTKGDPRLLTGMTATVSIVTSVNNNALVVPLDAVQSDTQGEYVNRVVNGVAERVTIKSGQLVTDGVIVTSADLKVGDKVQLTKTQTLNSSSNFGGPGGGGGAVIR